MNTAYKRIVEQANKAFAKGDTEGFLKLCADDVAWTMVGDRTVKGKEAIRQWMSSMGGEPPTFTVDHIVAADGLAFAEGHMTMQDEDGHESPYAYCDVYRFRGDQIAELKAFVIKAEQQPAPA
jgi:uncharacterized protein (TIGR02246 family)